MPCIRVVVCESDLRISSQTRIGAAERKTTEQHSPTGPCYPGKSLPSCCRLRDWNAQPVLRTVMESSARRLQTVKKIGSKPCYGTDL